MADYSSQALESTIELAARTLQAGTLTTQTKHEDEIFSYGKDENLATNEEDYLQEEEEGFPVETDRCYICRGQGHWSQSCSYNRPKYQNRYKTISTTRARGKLLPKIKQFRNPNFSSQQLYRPTSNLNQTHQLRTHGKVFATEEEKLQADNPEDAYHYEDGFFNTDENHLQDSISLDYGSNSSWISRSRVDNTITFPSSNPTIIKGLEHQPAASIDQDAIVNIFLPSVISLGPICCGVVPENLFPGHIVFGRTLFHAFGILTKDDGSVQFLRAQGKPILEKFAQGTVFMVNSQPHSVDENFVKIASIIREFYKTYPLVFKFDPKIHQRTVKSTTVEHHIEREPNRPIKIPARLYSPAQCKAINEFLDSALKRNLIQKSKSPWAAPALLAPKKAGTWRFFIDYYHLNHVTKKHAFPLPNIQDELQKTAEKNTTAHLI
ncbi:hypothetical protein GcM3_175019 [Golovinomyces cichoracearum]|uniref:CCHC-type domain-containing protein n=1 Tax=Golovinomyces cichoracearum TaxID=62708 RepID=A0A420HPM6_9PEZI|nr:hypothetical protein GcM3_175019 [Golovinomyces cichoracearum]